MPGAHPSSEGKRRRNRSNVEAMSAKDMEPARETPNGQQTGKYSVAVEINISISMKV